MTLVDVAPATIPTRTAAIDDPWLVDDIVPVDDVRWKIRALNRKTGRVVLKSMNTSNVEIYWTTSLEHLPRRAA